MKRSTAIQLNQYQKLELDLGQEDEFLNISSEDIEEPGGDRYFWPIPYPYLGGTFGKRDQCETRDPPPPFPSPKVPWYF